MTERLIIPVNDRDHVAGPRDARVVLVEYGDFECPYCGAAYPNVEAARARLNGQLLYVFRHFPLAESHPHSESAAEAAEAAGAQQRFWEMYHTLFKHQTALEVQDLVRYAEAWGLDVARFSRELSEGTYTPRVHEDFIGGVRSGVNGTPTFFINDVRYDGQWDDVQAFVDALTQAATNDGASVR